MATEFPSQMSRKNYHPTVVSPSVGTSPESIGDGMFFLISRSFMPTSGEDEKNMTRQHEEWFISRYTRSSIGDYDRERRGGQIWHHGIRAVEKNPHINLWLNRTRTTTRIILTWPTIMTIRDSIKLSDHLSIFIRVNRNNRLTTRAGIQQKNVLPCPKNPCDENGQVMSKRSSSAWSLSHDHQQTHRLFMVHVTSILFIFIRQELV